MEREQQSYRADVRSGKKFLTSISQQDFRAASIWLNENRDLIGPVKFGCTADGVWFINRAIEVSTLRDGGPAQRRLLDQDEVWQENMGGEL